MSLKKFKPRSPEVYLNKIKGDASLARLGHLNALVDDVENKKADQEIHEISYPFLGYPESTLFDAGPVYHYSAGMGMGPIPEVTLNSYKVRGILSYGGSSVISQYLGTVKIIPKAGGWIYGSIVFPGKLTGMVMATNDTNIWDPQSELTTTPLADGAMMWDIDAEDFNKLNDVRVMMYPYEDNPINGTLEVNYALVLEAYGTVPTSDFATALISYEFEFVSASDADVTIWWD